MLRASVIVPVYEPKENFDDLIRSFDRQTLDTAEFEVLLCDDGSGEATQARLAEVARTRPNVRVLTLPHTGWPGTPRNAGIDAAEGTYVFFADQDDRLFDGALQAMCDYADRNTSDVVIGKVVGVGRKIPAAMFRRDIPSAELGRDPILDMLTPHKMFRTAFLRDHGIRYPDGRVRLEDHLFVMRAYFAARTISVLASTPCYAWLKNPGSASSARIDPDTYFPHLEAVLDLVESNTEPGRLRDTLLRHWYRGKILNRLSGKRIARYPDEYRTRFFDAVIPLIQRHFGPGVDAKLSLPLRVRSALLHADRRDDLLRFAEFEAGLTTRPQVTSARWTRRGTLALTVEARIVTADGEPLAFESIATDASGPTSTWQPPAHLALGDLPAETLDATRDLTKDRIELAIRNKAAGIDRRIPGDQRPDGAARHADLDPLFVFGRDETYTSGRLHATVTHGGFEISTPLHADPAIIAALGPSPLLAGRRCELVLDEDGSLELRREWPGGKARNLIARTVGRLRRTVTRQD
ncbi:glycosyltransferase family 2 protein [Microbacterium sp. 179-B 1A2 NHS]|uniref:glycosyltransferase family 2 protein n=1 Tax=Microbacterium sp. 179-B 1A2 NHS TaxID=3142383 RepID=UPI0039A32B50